MEIFLLNATNTLTAGYEGHVYATISPISHYQSQYDNGWILLGETNKYVVAASKRFGTVTYLQWEGGTAMHVEVKGVEGETVKVCAAKGVNGALEQGCNMVTFQKTTTMTTIFK